MDDRMQYTFEIDIKKYNFNLKCVTKKQNRGSLFKQFLRHLEKNLLLVNFWEPFEDEVNQSELNKDPPSNSLGSIM